MWPVLGRNTYLEESSSIKANNLNNQQSEGISDNSLEIEDKNSNSIRVNDVGRLKPHELRDLIRSASFTSTTNGLCPGYIQANLVILPKSYARDFTLFCQSNPQPCPLLEVCDGSFEPKLLCRNGTDLRTDLPKYHLYRSGELVEVLDDILHLWNENNLNELTAFLIGCSFSMEQALLDAGIYLQENVPMYKTNIPCKSVGPFCGDVVVSMRPVKATRISQAVLATAKYPHAHGAPVCIGCPESIGIYNLDQPDYGVGIQNLADDELPMFHACGVTPQNVVLQSNIPFVITHAPGHMLVCDILNNRAVI